MSKQLETVETLIDEAKSIQDRLGSGAMSNTVARTLLTAIKIRLDGFKVNMAASSLGCSIQDHAIHVADRQKAIKLVA